MRREEILILDLALVPAMDAAGVGLLLQLRREAAAQGKLLRVASVSPRVRRILRLLHLADLLDLPNGQAVAA